MKDKKGLRNLRALRKKRGMTQRDLARAVGVSQGSVAMWEGGGYYPRASMMVELGKVLKVSIDELIGEEV